MAEAAADYLAERDVVAVFTSPLERARETAGPVAERFGLEPMVDERLIESWNHFEGLVFGVGDGSLQAAQALVVPARSVLPILGRALQGGRPAGASPR